MTSCGPVARRGEFFAQQLRGVALGEQLGLEVEAGRKIQVAVGRTRVAVDAAVLATAIRIDRPIEPDVRRFVAADDRAGLSKLTVVASGGSSSSSVAPSSLADAFDRLEAMREVRYGTATLADKRDRHSRRLERVVRHPRDRVVSGSRGRARTGPVGRLHPAARRSEDGRCRWQRPLPAFHAAIAVGSNSKRRKCTDDVFCSFSRSMSSSAIA